MNRKTEIIFDATHLAECESGYYSPSGIRYTTWNILRELVSRNELQVYLYCPISLGPALKQFLKRENLHEKIKFFYNPSAPFKLQMFVSDIFFSLNKKKLALEQKQKNTIQKTVFFVYRCILKLLRLFLAASDKLISEQNAPPRHPCAFAAFISPCYKIPQQFREMNISQYHTVLYDTIPLDDPDYKASWFQQLIDSFQPGDTFSAISQCAKNDFQKHIPSLRNAKINIMPLAASEDFYQDLSISQNEAIRKKYNIPQGKKYFLHLSYMDLRKNVMGMLRSFAEFLKQTDADDMIFVLAGKSGPKVVQENREELDKLQISDKVIAIGFVDDGDLASLYSHALTFVFMSSYEGFGLPVLEAMQCGTPVICSDNSSLPEVVGDAAIMLPWQDDAAVADAMNKLYSQRELVSELSAAGLKRSRLFSWKQAVNKLLEFIDI